MISAERVRDLSRIDGRRALAHVALEWLLIVAVVWGATRIGHPFAWALATLVVGARQHALAALMHDATHYRLLPNRRANDVLAELFLAWPLLITNRGYRRNHLSHHHNLNTANDPDWARKQNEDWRFPKSRLRMGVLFARDLFGLTLFAQLRTVRSLSEGAEKPSRTYRWGRLLYYAVIVAWLAWAGLLRVALLYWIVPIFTWLPLILRLRSIAEHFALPEGALAGTRNTFPSLVERLLLAPKNVGYHLDHHLFPSVPFYRLPDLHTALKASPGYCASAHETSTYVGVLREATRPATAF